MPEGITPDNTYRIKIGEEIVDISPSTNDHAVRFSERFGFLDHIVEFQPVSVEFEEGEMILLSPTRHFLGAAAVEMAVAGTGIGEVYYDSPCQSVYDDYQEQELAKLDSELGDLEDE